MSVEEPTSTVATKPDTGLYSMPWLVLTGAALCWGAHAVAGQISVGQVQPLMLVFLRWLIVSIVMWSICGREAIAAWPQIRHRLPMLTATAVLGFTAFNTLFYFASHRTTGVNIGIIQGTIPLFVLAGAFALHGVKVTVKQLYGAAIACIGLILVVTTGSPMAALQLGINNGDLVMLTACVLYAAYALLLKSRPPIPGLVFFTLLTPIAAISALPLLAFETAMQGFIAPSALGLAVILFVAIFPSCLGQIFFLRGVDLVGPGRAGIYINLVPVFAALLSVLVLGEAFAWYHLAGLILVVGGIWLVERSAPSNGSR